MAVRLDLTLASPERPVRYGGVVETPSGDAPITVEVADDERAADGLSAVAAAPELPESLRARVEQLAASMARKAVRAALKDDLRPPRRIRRWRRVQC